MSKPDDQIFTRHSREWRNNLYVYPVISRRSKGLSIGINLNPDKTCNFDCVYCQVDRATPPRVREVDPAVLEQELDQMLDVVQEGRLFDGEPFLHVPPSHRRLNDIAFSGDGESTASARFERAVQIVVDLKSKHHLDQTKIVLITNACYLTRPDVERTLELMDVHQGEIWAKIDAGSEAFFRQVNRFSCSLDHVLKNITAAARRRPIVIQSLFFRTNDQPPPMPEIEAYCLRLNDIVSQGGKIKLVQVYSVARAPHENFVSPLTDSELLAIVETIRSAIHIPTECFS